MGNGSFPVGKVQPGRAANNSPPSSAAVMEEYSYTSTQPLGHTGPVTGTLTFFNTLHLKVTKKSATWQNNEFKFLEF